jgi:malto-oligosyltrehalose trehalohydrolase
MPFGAEVQPNGSVRFRLLAPAVESVELQIEGRPERLPMERAEGRWFELRTAEAAPGSLYRFVLPDGLAVPDPASRYQPQDAHGPSEVVAPGAYMWTDSGWEGRPWREAVMYELHMGTFTPEGTFRAAMEKLDHLAWLGVTAVEVMPVAEFPGKRGWGYDGVLLYAPESSYGRPEDFKAFVAAAHARGISVLLDVVYNHFGPDGNYIPNYFPDLFTEEHKTSWGSAVNYDRENSKGTREFVLHNALYWLEEFHLDGLRLDAVHAIIDDGEYHILDELADRARTLITDRPIHLVLENERNEASRLVQDNRGEPRHYTAQWNDDMHHVLHTAATHEDAGYYKDYKGHTGLLGRALAEGFAFQGEENRCGEQRGQPCTHLPPEVFVAFIQNHDQIGNRAFGERINAIAPREAVRALAATYLLLPQTPMLFMGEEWCAPEPFPYFCDFGGELAEKVREGRRNEFAGFPEFQDPAKRDQIPDPVAAATFESAKLDWSMLGEAENAEWLQWYRHVLTVRRERIQPLLPRIRGVGRFDVIGPGAVTVRWALHGGGELRLGLNLCDKAKDSFPVPAGEVLWHEGPEAEGAQLGPWTVHWTVARG